VRKLTNPAAALHPTPKVRRWPTCKAGPAPSGIGLPSRQWLFYLFGFLFLFINNEAIS
jgi:hypothetical protein